MNLLVGLTYEDFRSSNYFYVCDLSTNDASSSVLIPSLRQGQVRIEVEFSSDTFKELRYI